MPRKRVMRRPPSRRKAPIPLEPGGIHERPAEYEWRPPRVGQRVERVAPRRARPLAPMGMPMGAPGVAERVRPRPAREVPRAGGRPPGMASPAMRGPMPTPPMRGPMPGPPSPEGGAVESMGQLIGQIVEGFRAYRDSYWPGVQDFATEGRETELTGENVREAWNEFLEMLRDAFDRFEF